MNDLQPVFDPAARRLDRDFYNRPTLVVAEELLGKHLVRMEDGLPVGGIIIETEAYIGEEDDACHARAGRTARTQVMYGPPGHAYVYFSYGMHWMLNLVSEEIGQPAAVLIRAIRPLFGRETIRRRRGSRPEKSWTDGPGKLCQALGIGREHNGLDVCSRQAHIFLTEGLSRTKFSVTNTPRVGLNKVAEPWKSIPWRFLIHHLPDRNPGQP